MGKKKKKNMEETETNIEPKDVYAIITLSRVGIRQINKQTVCRMHFTLLMCLILSYCPSHLTKHMEISSGDKNLTKFSTSLVIRKT